MGLDVGALLIGGFVSDVLISAPRWLHSLINAHAQSKILKVTQKKIEKTRQKQKVTPIMPAIERIDSAYNRSAKSISIISERAIDESRPLKVIYIGAGVSGIVGAIEFSKYVPSIELVIYEKNPEVGGTWYENRYPGCACGELC